MTFSKFHARSSPIFKHFNIVKLPDLVFLNIAVFMYKFHNYLFSEYLYCIIFLIFHWTRRVQSVFNHFLSYMCGQEEPPRRK